MDESQITAEHQGFEYTVRVMQVVPDFAIQDTIIQGDDEAWRAFIEIRDHTINRQLQGYVVGEFRSREAAVEAAHKEALNWIGDILV